MSWQTTPIDRKVAMTTLATTCAALILTAGSLIGYELLTFKRSIHEKIDLLGRIVASNSTAALAFRAEDEAEALLGSLRTEADITGAALYDAEGQLFVTYPPDRSRHTLPSRAGTGSRFAEGRLELFAPAIEAGVPQGTLYLEYDLASLLDGPRARNAFARRSAVAEIADASERAGGCEGTATTIHIPFDVSDQPSCVHSAPVSSAQSRWRRAGAMSAGLACVNASEAL